MMKKVLYGTTALVAASLAGTGIAAAKLDVSVGGYYQAVFVAGDHDDAAGGTEYRTTQVKQEGEIHFNAKTTLDNGLTVGMQVQLEAYTTGDQIDEHYVYLDGGWGRVLIGAENSAPYLMHYGAQSVVPGHGVDTPNFRHHPIRGANSSTTYLVSTSDANKITYFTPRFGGFQLGVSYTPDAAGTSGTSDSYTVLTADDGLEDVFEVGANYVQDFGGFNVALSGGFMSGDNNGTAAGESGWSAGARVGVAGFTAGVAYRDLERTSTNDETTLSASLWYGTGPWAVGLAYLTSEYDTGAGDDEYDAYELGLSYKLGAGVTAGFALQHYKSETAAGVDGDSTVGALVLGLSF
ncbi:porin [Futiania mangrovi]|uniref:Porin n=1 Tax=Futiania mangrovi TaxID=2959716 RepID=A0A9J6PFE1_9PROT|nr:porin [Futiania mangrovii]MCP1336515.1 porin [Futiania mangrovii]